MINIHSNCALKRPNGRNDKDSNNLCSTRPPGVCGCVCVCSGSAWYRKMRQNAATLCPVLVQRWIDAWLTHDLIGFGRLAICREQRVDHEPCKAVLIAFYHLTDWLTDWRTDRTGRLAGLLVGWFDWYFGSIVGGDPCPRPVNQSHPAHHRYHRAVLIFGVRVVCVCDSYRSWRVQTRFSDDRPVISGAITHHLRFVPMFD